MQRPLVIFSVLTISLVAIAADKTVTLQSFGRSGKNTQWTFHIEDADGARNVELQDNDGTASPAILTQLTLRNGERALARGETPSTVYPQPVPGWDVLGPVLREQLYRIYRYHLFHNANFWNGRELARLQPLNEFFNGPGPVAEVFGGAAGLGHRTPTFGELKQIQNHYLDAFARYHEYGLSVRKDNGSPPARSVQAVLDEKHPHTPLTGELRAELNALFEGYRAAEPPVVPPLPPRKPIIEPSPPRATH